MLTLKISKRFGSYDVNKVTSCNFFLCNHIYKGGAAWLDSGCNWYGKVMGERLWVRPLVDAGGARRGEQLGRLPACWRGRCTRLTDGLGAKPLVLQFADEHPPFFSGIHCGNLVRRRSWEGQGATGEVQPPAEEAGVECEEPIAVGRPGRSILAVAEEVEHDLIYLGAKGMSALKLFPLGNAYEEVLRHTYKTVSMGSAHPEAEGIEEAS